MSMILPCLTKSHLLYLQYVLRVTIKTTYNRAQLFFRNMYIFCLSSYHEEAIKALKPACQRHG